MIFGILNTEWSNFKKLPQVSLIAPSGFTSASLKSIVTVELAAQIP